MTTAFSLRVLMDVCLYLGAFSFLGAIFGQTTPLVAASLWLGLCAGASYSTKALCQRRGFPVALRFLPIAAMAVAYFEPRSLADHALLTPAVLYAAYLAVKRAEAPDYPSAMERFSLSWKVLLPVCFLEIVIGRWASFTGLTAPVVFLCALSALMLLRMLRHDPEVLSQRSFRLRNDMTVALVACVSLLFSADFAKRAGLFLITGAWQYGVLPILRLFVYLFTWIMRLIDAAFRGAAGLLPQNIELGTSEMMEQLDLSELMERSEEARGVDLTTLIEILKGLGALSVIVAAVLLLRRLARNRRTAAANASGDVRESLKTVLPAKPLLDLPPKNPSERIRWYYRKYLRLAQKRGLSLTVGQTTAEIRRDSAGVFARSAKPLDDIREAYLCARYRTQEDAGQKRAQSAKDAYASLKASKTQ